MKTWAFDLGIASLGEAVRQGAAFFHKASFLIPEEFGETQSSALRRRMKKTRAAHKAREQWLRAVWEAAGLQSLPTRTLKLNPASQQWETLPADSRMEREFPSSGDETCYTSCLLRIKLLRGEPLQPWQIYKALHASMQKRGWERVVWAAKEAARAGKTIEQLEQEEKTDSSYQQAIEAWKKFKSRVPEAYHFPCYYDAFQMGLWSPERPHELATRIDHAAGSTRGIRFDRADLRQEILRLAENGAAQLPALSSTFANLAAQGWPDPSTPGRFLPVRARNWAEFLVYGPSGTPPEEAKDNFASYLRHLRSSRLRPGTGHDWLSLLGQKIPRFDNRIINKCCLIPRLNVCKAEDDLAREVTFLLKLKNLRVESSMKNTGLEASQIAALFHDPSASKFQLTPAALKKLGRKHGFTPTPGHEEVKAPKGAGRARFCRPALRLLKELILSGKSPHAFYEIALSDLQGNADPRKGLVAEDLQFLKQMGSSWEGLYIPSQRLDFIEAQSTSTEEAIQEVIGSINNPLVRHRLTVFSERLDALCKKFGPPAEVVLEFVREDFMGEEAKKSLRNFQNRREKERQTARSEALALGFAERSAALKYELFQIQKGICLYTGAPLIASDIERYEIDHIVPRSQGGPDAFTNYVLTHRETNAAKGEKTPHQWLQGGEGWRAYLERIAKASISHKTRQLLSQPDAAALAERYTALAETAWISKLAQKIVSLRFGWRNGLDAEGRRRITVISGGLTGRIRRRYRLNSILNPMKKEWLEEEYKKAAQAFHGPLTEADQLQLRHRIEERWESEADKNRRDNRHHALDAMVISFLPQWMRDGEKAHFFRFPKEIHADPQAYFAREIASVNPAPLAYEKSALAETIYGARGQGETRTIVQRTSVRGLALKPLQQGKSAFDLAYARKQTRSIRDQHIRSLIERFLETDPTEQAWNAFCDTFTLKGKNGEARQPVRAVNVAVGDPKEYKDLSKDTTGAWFKGLKGHKGQIVYLDPSGQPRVEPIYAFASAHQIQAELKQRFGPDLKICGFFQSGCLVSIDQPIEHKTTLLSPDTYRLNSIRSDGYVIVTNRTGKTFSPISIKKFLKAGFRRVEEAATL